MACGRNGSRTKGRGGLNGSPGMASAEYRAMERYAKRRLPPIPEKDKMLDERDNA
jgi:hypothetical protein